MTPQQIDKAYDYALLSVQAICVIAIVLLSIKTLFDFLTGWYSFAPLYAAGIFLVILIITAILFIYLKKLGSGGV